MSKQLISYIFPIYNEAGNIELLYKTIADILKPINKYDFELVFINDGSSDTSLELLHDIQAHDSRVKVINFSRNFGHQLAVTAGLDNAEGDAIIIMDSDMQDPPQVSLELITMWESGYEVVYAQRRTRKDSVFKRFTAAVFYRLLNKLADFEIPRNTGDFRLIDRKVADTLGGFREHNRFLRGLVSYVGYRQAAVLFDREERHAGETGYPLRKMINFALDGIFSFSWTPLKVISRVGYTLALVSFSAAVYAVCMRLFVQSVVVPGWTFTVLAVLLTGGIQLVMLGVLGNYVGRIYTEVQNRPLYIIESIRKTKR